MNGNTSFLTGKSAPIYYAMLNKVDQFEALLFFIADGGVKRVESTFMPA